MAREFDMRKLTEEGEDLSGGAAGTSGKEMPAGAEKEEAMVGDEATRNEKAVPKGGPADRVKKPFPWNGLAGKMKTKLSAKRTKKKLGKSDKKQKITRAVVLGVLVLAAMLILPKAYMASKKTGVEAAVHKTATVERRSITSELSSSGTISPKDTYNVTSLASGEVITADFEEGDEVEKGQVLYVIDASSKESELQSAQNSLERAQTSYDLAAEDYHEAVSDYSGDTYKSTETGYIKTLYIKEGDKVSNGTKIADIYNDKIMKIRVPFLSAEAAQIGAGNQGVVTLQETGEQLLGTVLSVSNMEEALTGGRLVRYVTLQVENPGGLTTAHTATVTLGDFTCAMEGTFTASVDTILTADLASGVEVEALTVAEGDFLGKGTPVFRMTAKSAQSLVRSFKDAMDKAQESLESAQSKVDSTQDSYEDYTITAPISGTVITKSVKAGDKVSSGNSGAVTLATIYDMSQVTFEMSVDELDVQSVQVGQTVVVTADAFEDQTFSGKVTNVSLASTNSNGVTNYPVTVTLDEVGNLLPGMNVDGQIILEEAQDVLVIPVDALMRGNKVYVKDDSVKTADGAVPAGFRSVDVETGLINDDYVEIVSGLSEGDEVYVSESSASAGMSMEMMMPAGGMGGAPGGGQGGGPGGGGGPR